MGCSVSYVCFNRGLYCKLCLFYYRALYSKLRLSQGVVQLLTFVLTKGVAPQITHVLSHWTILCLQLHLQLQFSRKIRKKVIWNVPVTSKFVYVYFLLSTLNKNKSFIQCKQF